MKFERTGGEGGVDSFMWESLPTETVCRHHTGCHQCRDREADKVPMPSCDRLPVSFSVTPSQPQQPTGLVAPECASKTKDVCFTRALMVGPKEGMAKV